MPQDAGTIQKGDLTLEKILEEKKVFDVSVRFERLGKVDEKGWSLPGTVLPFPFVSVCCWETDRNIHG